MCVCFRCERTVCGDFGADRFKGVCDKNGCDIQHTRFMGKGQTFYGPGSKYKIDTTKPATVTTQYINADGTDTGKLTEVKQFYTQNGHIIEHPKYSLNGNKHNAISDKICATWVHETKDGRVVADAIYAKESEECGAGGRAAGLAQDKAGPSAARPVCPGAARPV